jgi:hypothetical protein
MIIPLPQPEDEFSKEEQERLYWERFIDDSHRWVEFRKGYYQCSFCLAISTTTHPPYKFMCEKNPFLAKPEVIITNTTKP